MTTRLWTGTDGDWSVAGNWDPSGVPVDNDVVILNEANDVAITSGLSQATVDLNLLFIGDGFTKNIGSTGSKLTISTDLVIHRGKGSLFLASGTGINNDIIVAHTGSQQNVSLEYSGKVPDRLVVSRGRVTIDITVTGTMLDLVLSSVTSRLTDADVTFQSDGGEGTLSNLFVFGGTFRTAANSGDIVNVFLAGGLAILDPLSGGVSPTVHISGGARLEWNNNTIAIAEANVYDGLLDFTQTREEKTVNLVNLWPDGEFRFFPDLTTRTVKEFDGKTVDIG